MQLTLDEIAKVLGSSQTLDSRQVTGFAIDSRATNHDEAFFAIKGARVDGHDYADNAVKKGASIIIAEKPLTCDVPVIITNSTEEALIKLGHYYASKFQCEIVGITGSAGKTTTKELTAEMLSAKYKVAKNEGNRNTPIGLPMALRALQTDTEIFVAEMSGSYFEEIPTLLRIVKPRIGVVTNVGPSHLETLGSTDGVAKAKGELIKSLPAGGIAVLNADDPKVIGMSNLTKCKVVTYGINSNANVFGRLVEDKVCVFAYGMTYTFRPKIPTVHFLYDVLAASSVALEYGIDLRTCIETAEAFRPIEGRGVVITNSLGVNIIDESYNANPVSMKETLRMLSQRPGKRFAVLADMLQLGEDAVKLHREVGEYAESLRLDGVFLFGNLSSELSKIIGRSQAFDTKESLMEALKSKLGPGDWVLVKGSNGMGMKEVVASLATL
jgi:UDP-N-acetylmuramoyl-tripeptide--D-alanyl-D-alanine ligase